LEGENRFHANAKLKNEDLARGSSILKAKARTKDLIVKAEAITMDSDFVFKDSQAPRCRSTSLVLVDTGTGNRENSCTVKPR